MAQRLSVRGLLQGAGVPYENGREGGQIPALLQHLKDLAGRAGGAPPLPQPPNTDHIDALLVLGGNQLFRAVADTHDDLRRDLESWRSVDQQRERRETAWKEFQRLLRHAEGRPFANQVAVAADAVRDGRLLLDDPDPVKPLMDELADSLREELKQRREQLISAQEGAIHQLESWDEWSKLDSSARESILAESKLIAPSTDDISSDTKLLEALDTTSLGAWQDRIGLIPGRRDLARQRAAKQLEPEAISLTPPSATLKTNQDLDAYLTDLREQILRYIEANKTVII